MILPSIAANNTLGMCVFLYDQANTSVTEHAIGWVRIADAAFETMRTLVMVGHCILGKVLFVSHPFPAHGEIFNYTFRIRWVVQPTLSARHRVWVVGIPGNDHVGSAGAQQNPDAFAPFELEDDVTSVGEVDVSQGDDTDHVDSERHTTPREEETSPAIREAMHRDAEESSINESLGLGARLHPSSPTPAPHAHPVRRLGRGLGVRNKTATKKRKIEASSSPTVIPESTVYDTDTIMEPGHTYIAGVPVAGPPSSPPVPPAAAASANLQDQQANDMVDDLLEAHRVRGIIFDKMMRSVNGLDEDMLKLMLVRAESEVEAIRAAIGAKVAPVNILKIKKEPEF